MNSKSKSSAQPVPIDYNTTKWWRVPIKCYGRYADCISICVPLFEGKRYNNFITTYAKKDMPPELWDVIQNRMTFYAEVPVDMQHAFELRIRNVELPKV